MRETPAYEAILQEGREEAREKARIEGLSEIWVEYWAKGYAESWLRGWVEGRLEVGRQWSLLTGIDRFGEADAATTSTVNAIQGLERLDSLRRRLLDPNVRSWAEWLADD